MDITLSGRGEGYMFGKSAVLLSVDYSRIQTNLGEDLPWWGVGKGEASQ